MTEIAKTYDPTSLEQTWYQIWESNGDFKPSGHGESFSLMLPPPNVTGSLHMGHGFGSTLMDVLVRYHRMQGHHTLWQAGTDHAGIATQMVVERQLNREGKTRHDLGREAFIQKIWEWKEQSGNTITKQFRRLGASMDWERERFTMDEDLSYAVREVFIQLYQEGLIYRGKRLVNWDPTLLTAISDLEVLNEEEDGFMWHIRYPLMDSVESLVVATTRPETMLGDVAVAVHPKDERYQHLIGKNVQLPLTGRTIPIIADDYVDPQFGTGCVKITPAHDFNDYDVGLRHQLEPINIFTPTAHLNDSVPEAYRGLERFVAREKVITDLTENEFLVKTEKHKLKVPRGDRSGVVIEPYLTLQWYVKCQPLAEPAIAAVKNKKVKFIPENWDKTYFQWMDNIEDWCISRQLWWGHRVPVWYDDSGNTYVGHDEADTRKRHQLSHAIRLRQDDDVLDTWFSSALWPFSSLGWPKQTDDFKHFFPTNVLVTAFDIIFFWVARMIMMSLKFTGKVPFETVYITGLIRDAEGHKMSKSKGNVLDPIDLIDGITLDDLVKKRTFGLMQPKKEKAIEKATCHEFPDGIPSFGTDAVRFTFCSMASYTREIRFDINRLAGYRNFCNKLWNAARYVQMNLGDYHPDASHLELSLADKWIWSRLQDTIQTVHDAMAEFRFDQVAHALYDFTWNEFCDWYLELSKPILTSKESPQAALQGTRHTLVNVLETLLRLLHPVMPFITEEIWQRIREETLQTKTSILHAPYPDFNTKLINTEAVEQLEWLKKVIVSIRTVRSEMNISPAKSLTVLLRRGSATDKAFIESTHALLCSLAKLASVTWIADNEAPPPSASAFVGDLEIYMPLAGFVNVEEETARLNREIEKNQAELTRLDQKLGNASFVDRAPAEVVEKERAKQVALKQTLAKLSAQVNELQSLTP